ncbi:MAG TPA: NUDIX domain-containing protein [Pirellulales bacterium]|nr:NUDIX domain-containing protein [Pirellulales bacterium]
MKEFAVVQSAGLVVYRQRGKQLEVLLVHPSGNYNRRAPWGIPKGLPDEGEALADAAVRETREESGVNVVIAQQHSALPSDDSAQPNLVPLGHIDYTKSRKRIHAFAVAAPENAAPHPASWEVDRAEFFPLDEAQQLIHPEQRPFLERLEKLLTPGDTSNA